MLLIPTCMRTVSLAPLCLLKKYNHPRVYLLILEGGEGRERERNIDVKEKHQSIASHMCPTRSWTCNLGICPEWGSNATPFCLQEDVPTNWTTWQGLACLLSYNLRPEHFTTHCFCVVWEHRYLRRKKININLRLCWRPCALCSWSMNISSLLQLYSWRCIGWAKKSAQVFFHKITGIFHFHQ